MAETFPTYVERRLKDGYTISKWEENWYTVVDPDRRWVRDPHNSCIIKFLTNEPDTHTRQNLISSLRRAGAIRERTRSSDHSCRPIKSVSNREPKNAVIIAQETLRDVLASPRERALARNYLELFESHKTVRALAQKLGRRLKELEKLID